MTPIEKILIGKIENEGPVSLETFMEMALGHPEHGYYRTRDPFGAKGDFTTAPEVSQMFGELIGLWCADLWMQMGKPENFILSECGPGRGTLMADALRAARSVHGFSQAVEIHLIETSPFLREKQKKTIHTYSPHFHENIEGLRNVQRGRPLILIANELLDALPIRQFSWRDRQWKERLVNYKIDMGFHFIWKNSSLPHTPLFEPEENAICEIGLARDAFVRDAAALTKNGGAALFIDYGYMKTAPGDTLQALKDHKFEDVLDNIGEADITAHVNFETCTREAGEQGAEVFGPVTQGRFLLSLGLAQRSEALIQSVSAGMKDSIGAQNTVQEIKSAVLRLSSPSEMGQLFKVLCVSHDKSIRPAGF